MRRILGSGLSHPDAERYTFYFPPSAIFQVTLNLGLERDVELELEPDLKLKPDLEPDLTGDGPEAEASAGAEPGAGSEAGSGTGPEAGISPVEPSAELLMRAGTADRGVLSPTPSKCLMSICAAEARSTGSRAAILLIEERFFSFDAAHKMAS